MAEKAGEQYPKQPRAGLSGKLRGLRWLMRARLAAEGLAWLLMATVAAVFLTLALDYLLRLDDLVQRAVVVGLGLGAVALVAWRELLGPLLVPMKAEALALLVEKRFGQLRDRLVSAVQFAGLEPSEGTSRAMIARTAAEAEAMCRPLEFRSVVERRRMCQVVLAAACTLGLLAGFSAWRSDVMSLWYRRNVLFADVSWPQKTYLEVLDGPHFTVLRGDDLPINVAVREGSAAPAHITLHAVYPSVGRPTEERIDRVGNSGLYVKVIRGVNEPFEFYVTGGDDETDKLAPHRVRVVDPPILREVTFIVEYPPYTNLEPRRFDGIREVLTVPYGGRVRVEAIASKELAWAEARLEDTAVWSGGRKSDAENAPPLGSRRIVANFSLPCENRFASKTLKFLLRDSEDFRNREGQNFRLQVLADEPPAVGIAKIGGLPEMRSITPTAKVPFRVAISDGYGIGLLELADEQQKLAAEAANRLGVSADDVRRSYRLPAGKVVAQSGDAIVATERLTDLMENRVHTRLELAHLFALQGRVKPGREIRVLAAAEDGRTGDYGGPGVGRSEQLGFEVVEVEVMRNKLLGKQKKVAEDFAAAIQLQSTAYAKSAAAADSQAFKRGKATAALRTGLLESARQQRAAGDACGQAARTFQGLLEESRYNGIGEANEYAAMTEGIITPLRRLTGECGEVAAELNQILGEIERASDVKETDLLERTAAAAVRQQYILDEMKAIGRRMEKLRSLQAMANKVARMIEWLEEIHREIEKQRAAGLEQIFEPPGRGKPTGVKPK